MWVFGRALWFVSCVSIAREMFCSFKVKFNFKFKDCIVHTTLHSMEMFVRELSCSCPCTLPVGGDRALWFVSCVSIAREMLMFCSFKIKFTFKCKDFILHKTLHSMEMFVRELSCSCPCTFPVGRYRCPMVCIMRLPLQAEGPPPGGLAVL